MNYSGYIRKAVENLPCERCRQIWLQVLKPMNERDNTDCTYRIIGDHVIITPHDIGVGCYRACEGPA